MSMPPDMDEANIRWCADMMSGERFVGTPREQALVGTVRTETNELERTLIRALIECYQLSPADLMTANRAMNRIRAAFANLARAA